MQIKAPTCYSFRLHVIIAGSSYLDPSLPWGCENLMGAIKKLNAIQCYSPSSVYTFLIIANRKPVIKISVQ